MADTVLKFAPSAPADTKARAAGWAAMLRARARMILLVIVPLIALVAGLGFYLAGGRYVSTDNAYVGAQKVLITPDVSGKIDQIAVREGQHVAAGDALVEIDPEPYRLALAQAQAKLAAVRTDFSKLKTDLGTLTGLAEIARKNVELKQRDVDRKNALVASRTSSPADLDTSMGTLMTAQLQAKLAEQQHGDTLNALIGNPDLPIEQFPAYAQAKAALDQAQRDLNHTVLRAPIAGTATQVDAIQLGRFVAAGTPLFSVVDDTAPWVDANPKETDLTYLKPGQPVTIEVDTFPDHPFHGRVASVSPGTGAQFAILPPQNASGNWVKVVQRVPVRIAFDQGEDVSALRSGMSVTVDIDTGHRRSFATLLGLRASAKGN